MSQADDNTFDVFEDRARRVLEDNPRAYRATMIEGDPEPRPETLSRKSFYEWWDQQMLKTEPHPRELESVLDELELRGQSHAHMLESPHYGPHAAHLSDKPINTVKVSRQEIRAMLDRSRREYREGPKREVND